uniref:Phosphatidylserine decarboxylase n=1 Tax=Cucumis sativus TaxID=3659 RepID=A0A0A0K1Y3_CUCSA
MDSVESAKDISHFIESFKDQINMNEVKHPLEYFKTFNEFFIRELKPGVRPIAHVECDDVAVCAADCRLMAFKSIDDSLRLWIKGRKFSVQGLLGQDISASAFMDGTLVIFRLAPQDYHRFHFPVSGFIEQIVDIPGCLYTVHIFRRIERRMIEMFIFQPTSILELKLGHKIAFYSFVHGQLWKKDSIQLDEDLLANSSRSLETLVRVGTKLGLSTRNVSQTDFPDVSRCAIDDPK